MQHTFKKIKRNGGQAMLLSVIFFLSISLSIITGLVSPSVREFKIADDLINSRQSYFLSESGTEDAYYRVKNSMTISSPVSLTIGGNTTATTITTNGNQKTIASVGDVSSRYRTSQLVTSSGGAGIGFNYGLQTGAGGLTINGGSTLTGSMYSNGIISAISATITGSASSADSPALVANQVNNIPTTPTNAINFGNASATQDYAQSFQVSANVPLNKVQFYIKKVGAPSGTFTVRLVADNAGSPSTTNLPLGTAVLGSITTSYAWVTATFTSNPALVPNTTYWVVLDYSTSNASNYYTIGANADTSYTLGTAKTGVYNGTWTAASLDSYFQIYTGGVSGYIGGATYVGGVTIGTGSSGDAWATTVAGASVAGNLYCTTGTNNNKSCVTSHGAAPQITLPFTDANINTWETNAAAGGTITGSSDCPGGYSGGNCTVNYAGATFGPGKITGNLTINGGGTLTLTGTIWVVGSVTITGGGKIQLPSNYALNSETIISNNLVSISGGGSLGSGTSGSYLFIVSTSRCPEDTYCSGSSAITVTGGAGAIAVDAQYGDVSLSGGASLVSAVGNSMTITGGTNITYNSGLASPSFINGPAGAGWGVNSWQEVQ